MLGWGGGEGRINSEEQWLKGLTEMGSGQKAGPDQMEIIVQ